MCGICGIINLNGSSAHGSALVPMMEKIKHRGPNDNGTFAEANVALGFVRLSIIDLSAAGHQPMVSRNGNYVLVFNGEIYNYIEIREELIAKGHTFDTKTDTEVLLNAYLEWGNNCLHKFNGMWAFAIYNRSEGKLFAARDRFGVKPFYYYTDGERFIFASEIPAIITALRHKPQPNYQAIFDYLVFNRTDQTEETFFAGIKKLQHGNQLSIEKNNFSISSWYNLKKNLKEPFREPEEFRALFSSAVGLRLRSDVPVGVCLSGGLDSSAIASVLLHDYNRNEISTFSSVYGKGKNGDESEFIAEYHADFQNMFFTTPTADSLYNDLQNFVLLHAEPIPSTSPYVQYKVMELASKNVVVTLDGQGADEELAGYHYFFGLFFKDLLNHGNWGLLAKEIRHYLANHHSLYGIKTFAYFMLPRNLRTFARVTQNGYLTKTFATSHKNTNTIAGNLYASGSLQEALLDHFEYKLEHLLKWGDRNSMWFSLESRMPFLDYRIVERILATPATQIINNGNTKHLLREAMTGTLPEKIRTRKDKVGFESPQDEWLKNPKFTNLAHDIIHSKQFKERNIIDPAKAIAIHNKYMSNSSDTSREIWKWIHLETWFRTFID